METEFIITVAIVLCAGVFVAWRWIRSARRALKPSPPGTCGGGCGGCELPPEMRRNRNANPSSDVLAACSELRQSDTTPPGGQ